MPVRNLLIITIAAIASMACYEQAQRNRYASGITEAMNLIASNYVEEVDPRKLYENAMDGLVGGLDPYSTYISPGDYQQFQETLDQEFGGIGIVVELNPKSKRLTVMSPLVGTPAYRAGMRAGDVILKIGDQDTEGMTLKDAVALMRGAVGTPIQVTVLHAGQSTPVPFTVKRAIIPIDSVLGDRHNPDGSWDFRLEQNPRITYIRLTNFGEQTVRELREALKSDTQHHKMEALILDLRGNAGGLLKAAVGTCDAFIDKGKIVTIRGRGGREKDAYVATPQTAIPADVPIVVLINQYSASASEIVSACLQDHQRAVVVGQRSWGKGTVQNIILLEAGESALKLTTASYWRPSDQNIHRKTDAKEEDDWGVTPSQGFEVKLSDEDFEKVLLQRRRRDIFYGDARPPKQTSVNPDKNVNPEESSPEEPAKTDASPSSDKDVAESPEDGQGAADGGESVVDGLEDFEDPQLRKAIDYLEEKLRQRELTPQAA
jgi:carboxyl-terminal processing protease